MRKRFIQYVIEKPSFQMKHFSGHIKRLVKVGLVAAARGIVHGIFSSIGGLTVAAFVCWIQNR